MKFKAIFGRFWWLALVAAAFVGVAVAMDTFVSLPSQGVMFSAARGVAEEVGVTGLGAASVGDRVFAMVWKSWGVGGLSFVSGVLKWATAWLAVTVIFLAAVLVVRRVRSKAWRSALVTGVLLACMGVLTLGILSAVRAGNARPSSALAYPVDLLKELKATGKMKVFANMPSVAQQVLWAPETMKKGDVAGWMALPGNPPAWRAKAREEGWDAVLLTGSTSEYAPLLAHLMAAPDWQLAAVTPHGYLFVTGAGPDVPVGEISVIGASQEEKAAWMAGLALRFNALRWNEAARTFLTEALKEAPKNADVLSQAAAIAAERKQWRDALKYADDALAARPSDTYARLVRVLALNETGRKGEAIVELETLREVMPGDAYTLFLYARLCRESYDYRRESDALRELIALAEKRGEAAADYRIYLGQALAKQGFAKDALREFQMAMQSGTLGKEHAAVVQEAIDAIERNVPEGER